MEAEASGLVVPGEGPVAEASKKSSRRSSFSKAAGSGNGEKTHISFSQINLYQEAPGAQPVAIEVPTYNEEDQRASTISSGPGPSKFMADAISNNSSIGMSKWPHARELFETGRELLDGAFYFYYYFFL